MNVHTLKKEKNKYLLTHNRSYIYGKYTNKAHTRCDQKITGILKFRELHIVTFLPF